MVEQEYKGAIIKTDGYGGWTWEHPEYVDCEFVDNDSWVCTGCGYGDTFGDCQDQIDDFLKDLDL